MTATNRAIAQDRPRQSEARQTSESGNRYVLVMVAVMIGCAFGMFFLGNTPLRLPFRMGEYLASLALLYFVRGRSAAHPAVRWVPLILAFLLIGMMHPDGGPLAARAASIALYGSVLAPLFWLGRIRLNVSTFRIVILALWVFYTMSALVGVLQVMYPGKYDGATSTGYDEETLSKYTITLSSGAKVVKPKGLSDVPSGASGAGVYACLLGTGVLLTERGRVLHLAAVGGFSAGLFCIYICQERTNLILVAIGIGCVFAVLLMRRAVNELVFLSWVVGPIIIIGTILAISIGGAGIVDRFSTLFASNPLTVYSSNRGFALYNVGELVLDFPFGAGLGRWGNASSSFGNESSNMYVEMSWEALAIDGGFSLIALYVVLLTHLLLIAWKIGTGDPNLWIGCWGAVILGYSLAVVAATFVCPLMSTQGGIELVLMNSCLYSVSAGRSSTLSFKSAVVPSMARPFAERWA